MNPINQKLNQLLSACHSVTHTVETSLRCKTKLSSVLLYLCFWPKLLSKMTCSALQHVCSLRIQPIFIAKTMLNRLSYGKKLLKCKEIPKRAIQLIEHIILYSKETNSTVTVSRPINMQLQVSLLNPAYFSISCHQEPSGSFRHNYVPH